VYRTSSGGLGELYLLLRAADRSGSGSGARSRAEARGELAGVAWLKTEGEAERVGVARRGGGGWGLVTRWHHGSRRSLRRPIIHHRLRGKQDVLPGSTA